MSSSRQLRAAVVALLRGDTALQTLIGQRVYSFVPRSTPYPYVMYFEALVNQEDTSAIYGKEHLIQFHCFDDHEGPARINDVLEQISLLMRWPLSLTMTDHVLVNSHFDRYDLVREEQLYHGISNFRLVTEEK